MKHTFGTNIWQQYQRNTLDSKAYFESNTEGEEPKETTIEDIDPSAAEARIRRDRRVERGENLRPPAQPIAEVTTFCDRKTNRHHPVLCGGNDEVIIFRNKQTDF